MNNKSEVTIILVSFYSQNLIEKTIDLIDSKIDIFVVENSNSKECKDFLESKYNNVKVILSEKNLGNGSGINIALKQIKTKYGFYLDIDTEIKKDSINNLLVAAQDIVNFTILAPLVENYSYKRSDYLKNNLSLNENYK